MKGKSLFLVLLFGALSVLCEVALAQRTTAKVYGLVKDTSGVLVPGITVTLANELTGTEQKVTTNEGGEFSTTEWLKKGNDLSSLQGKVVQMEFQLRGASLYAMQFLQK